MGLDNCYVCGKENQHGLKVDFKQVGDDAVATFVCNQHYSGWPGVQHGGVTAALLDEASGYVPQFMGVVAMTAKLDVRYIKPIQVGEVVQIVGRPVKKTKRVIEVESTITGQDGTLRAQSFAKMFVLTEQQQIELGFVNVK